jgi:molecular chaperone DnaK
MKKDAEAHADEDHKRREMIDIKNQGDNMAYQMEKMLRDQGDKIPAADRSAIESAIANLRTALQSEDADAIKKAMGNLEQASHKVAEAMYKNAPGAAPGGPKPGPAPQGGEQAPKDKKGGDDVIDAEYEVKE